jgi:hypothetical protein
MKMANTYTELIERMDCYPTLDTYTDVVCTIFWRMNATNGEYSATAYGSCGVTFKEGDTFTPYEDLTKEQVWGWVSAIVNMDDMKASLDKQIEAQLNPPIVSPPLPFEN